MLTSRFRLKLRTSSGPPGAVQAAASCDVAHGRQVRPTEPFALVEKFFLRLAYLALGAVGPSEAGAQLSIWRSLRATPTSSPEIDSVPLGIADVVLFLASDAAHYICGALVKVNGGRAVA